MRCAVLLLLTTVAFADRNIDVAAVHAMRDYYASLTGRGSGIHSVRDRLVPIMKDISPKLAKSVRNQIRRGFDKKYEKDTAYHRCLAEILAAAGKPGIAILFKQYKSSRKNEPLCIAFAEVFGACNDPRALRPLLKMMYDKRPDVAAATVKSCASYAKVKEKTRKEAVKKMVTRFMKVSDDAAGKRAETVQMKMYLALKPVMNETLKAFTGQGLDSALSWNAWLGENLAKPWSE